jgi:hypothetical protein
VLYRTGDGEGDLQPCLNVLRDSVLRIIGERLIPNSDHFAPDEQPDEVTKALRESIALGFIINMAAPQGFEPRYADPELRQPV